MAVKSGLMLTTDPIAGQNKSIKLKSLVEQWSETSGFGFLFGIPLIDRADGRTTGFLVLEADHTIDRANFATALRQVQPHVAIAISNAKRFESIPFRKCLAALKHVAGLSSLFKLAVLMAVIAAVVVAMVFNSNAIFRAGQWRASTTHRANGVRKDRGQRGNRRCGTRPASGCGTTFGND